MPPLAVGKIAEAERVDALSLFFNLTRIGL